MVAGAFTLLLGVPLVGYLGAVLGVTEPEQWVRVCSLDQIRVDVPTDFNIAFPRKNAPEAYQEARKVFTIRKGSDILAFSNVCTHMGCSVRWLAWREQILCPCHGGMYDRWGQLTGGPPSASLPLYVSRIQGNDLYVTDRFQPRRPA